MSRATKYTHSTISNWLLSHARAFKESWRAFIKTPISHFFTVCVISIAIALPLCFFVLLQNLQSVNHNFNTSAPMISLYLKSSTTEYDIQLFTQQLKKNPMIKKVNFISAQEGEKSFAKNTPFGGMLNLFQRNPLPNVITVLPSTKNQNPNSIHVLFSTLQQSPLVRTVQLDMNWVARLFNIITIGKIMVNVLFVLFGVGIILMIGHALRASLAKHETEIRVMRLMGATQSYICRPLLYRGMLYGLMGGILSWILVDLFILQLQKPVLGLAESYHTNFQLNSVSISQGGVVLLSSVLMGLCTAWVIGVWFCNQPEET